MGKQTMGTPCHTYKFRADNKLYRILTPQSPVVRPKMHDYYHMDDYALGTNAVVAVISYTVSFLNLVFYCVCFKSIVCICIELFIASFPQSLTCTILKAFLQVNSDGTANPITPKQ